MTRTASGRLVFNGRFLTSRRSGAQRVAEELLISLDRINAAQPEHSRRQIDVLVPPGAARTVDLESAATHRVGAVRGQAWEQLVLPLAVGDGLLISLANLAPLAGPPGILMIHDAQAIDTPSSYSPAFRHWYQFALPRLARHARQVVTVSNYSKGRLAATGIAPEHHIRVIYNGVDHIIRTAPSTAPIGRFGLTPHRYVVALATTIRHKNVGMLFDVFSLPGMEAIDLVLVGAADRAAFRAAGFNPPERTRFVPDASDADFAGLVSAALAFAFPSRTEGFGLPPIEAMLLGCPAIVTRGGALPEVCGAAGIYADPDAPAEWRDKILALLANPEERLARRDSLIGHARTYTWDKAGRTLLDIIEHLESPAPDAKSGAALLAR